VRNLKSCQCAMVYYHRSTDAACHIRSHVSLILFVTVEGDKERPDSQCDSLLRVLLQEGSWLPQRRLEACEDVDLRFFRDRVATSLQTMTSMLSYAHGSTDRSTAVDTFDIVGENLFASQLNSKASVSAQHVRIDVKHEWGYLRDRARLLPGPLTGQDPPHHIVALPTFNMEDPNSALVRYIQVRADGHMIHAPCSSTYDF